MQGPSDDFRNMSSEVASLHLILKELEENLSDEGLDSQHRLQLGILGNSCNDVLKDLESLLRRNQNLGTKTQRRWDKMKWGFEGMQSIRGRLTSNVSLLTAFNTTLQRYVTAALHSLYAS